MRQISIKQITFAGMFLALLTITKYLDLVMIKINGYSAIEFYWIVAALSMVVLSFTSSVFVLVIAPFLWVAIGQAELVSLWGVILDYFIPLGAVIVIKFSRNWIFASILVLVAGVIKLFSHTLSGILFYDATFNESITINAPFTAITMSVAFVIMIIVYRRLRFLARFTGLFTPSEIVFNLTGKKAKVKLIRFGYLNKVYTTMLDSEKYILRIPRFAKADWENESKIYKAIFKDKCFIDNEHGHLLKPFIEGETAKEWTPKILKDLNERIMAFHNLKIDGIIEHDWNKWNKFSKKISKDLLEKYLLLVEKHKDDRKVLSHNDINRENLIVQDNDLILIDFEWTRMNHELFDYAQFYIAEGVHIVKELESNQTYNELIFMTLVFSVLWTYSIWFSPKAIKLRYFYKNNLKKLEIY